MRYPAILATISLIVFCFGLTAPASAQFTQNNTPAAGSGQDGSFVFVLQLDEQSLQDLRNGQPLKSNIPMDLRNKVTAVRLEYVGNSNTSSLPATNPNGVSTGQQFGPQIPDAFRNPNGNFGSNPNPSNVASGNPGGANNPFPNTNPANNNWNNSNPANNQPGNQSTIPQFIPPLATQPANTNFQQPNQPVNNSGALAPITPRNDQMPAWQAPATNNSPTYNNNFNPATGQGAGNQPSNNQPNSTPPAYNPNGTNYVPPYRPTNDSFQQGQPGSNQVDTTQQYPNYNNYQQGQNVNPALQAANPNQYQYDSNGNPIWPNNRNQTQSMESLLGNMQQQINTLSQQYPGAGQRSDSLIAGHQFPVTSNYPLDPRGYGPGQGGLLASVRAATSGQNVQLPSAFIPGTSTNTDPAIGQRRETASISAAIEDANRKNGFLFFWLMCSIGLNIYLGWISRGFYARYRELADELRETFSTA